MEWKLPGDRVAVKGIAVIEAVPGAEERGYRDIAQRTSSGAPTTRSRSVRRDARVCACLTSRIRSHT
jgi:hypothetical protein